LALVELVQHLQQIVEQRVQIVFFQPSHLKVAAVESLEVLELETAQVAQAVAVGSITLPQE
jgi:hypothetical protein